MPNVTFSSKDGLESAQKHILRWPCKDEEQVPSENSSHSGRLQDVSMDLSIFVETFI